MQIARSNTLGWALRGPNTLAAKLARSLAGIPAALRRRARLNATINEMSKLSDRSLADNGFARDDIPAIAARSVALEFNMHSE